MKTFRLQADLTFEADNYEQACRQLSNFVRHLGRSPERDYVRYIWPDFAGELFLKPIDEACTVGTQLKLEF